MTEEPKVPVAPDQVVESAGDEPLIVNRREAVENQMIEANNTPSEVVQDLSTDSKPLDESTEPNPEPVTTTDDPLERIKKSVQKRIDKVVAQKKTVEEELAEARAEIERLRNPKPAETTTLKDDAPPTPEQVEAYILKMREEGNAKEEIAATRYLIKLEKELAIKAVREEQDAQARKVQESKQKELESWVTLNQDFSGDNLDLNLSNQKGLLYTTAMALYQDKELNQKFYSDPDKINGFRRAVNDAFRELHQQGLVKQPTSLTPKRVEINNGRESIRRSLADPSTESIEETPVQSQVLLSDAEKVREEIKSRSRMRNSRKVS